MDLLTVKKYLENRKTVPLPDAALHFRVAPETIRPLFEIWVQKGKAKKLTGTAPCKGCCKCDPATLESYQWLG